METKKTAVVLTEIINLLNELEKDDCKRVLQTAGTFFNLEIAMKSPATSLPSLDSLEIPRTAPVPFSGRVDISPKEFMLQKSPRTDVQRIACLAFYLAHYKNTPHFQTTDLSSLNTEAAQQKFSNIAKSASNALQLGYLVAAGKDKRQLSTHGEQFVLALPDQSAATLVMSQRNGRAKARSSNNATTRNHKRVDRLLATSSR